MSEPDDTLLEQLLAEQLRQSELLRQIADKLQALVDKDQQPQPDTYLNGQPRD